MDRIRQNTQNIVQTLLVLFHITSQLPCFIILITLLNAALPFVNIVFSQLMIDEFIDCHDYRILTAYAVLSILLNVVILFLVSILSKRKTEAYAKLELGFQKKLNFHQMNLAYADMKSNKVKELQRSMEQTQMRNGGAESIIDNFEIVIQNVFNLVFAFFSFLHIFTFPESAKQSSFWTKPWPLLILLLLTILSVVFSLRLQAKQNEKILILNQQANEANGGAFSYMQLISDYHFGKDIRIYNLKSFLCNEFNNLWSSSIGYKLTKKLGQEKSKIPCMTAICNSILDLFIFLL